MPKIAVIGAGVIGLTTAVNVQQTLPNAEVTIIADRFTTQTTSHGAAGLFRPTLELVKGIDTGVLKHWIADGWSFYSSMAESAEGSEAGIHRVSGYSLFKKEPKLPDYRHYVYSFRDMTPIELDGFPGYSKGWFCTTLMVECTYFLPWLMRKFKDKGGRVLNLQIHTMEELAGKYDIVVNCSGIGARRLIGDTSVYPVRGQMFRVKAPWVNHFVYEYDTLAYAIPCRDTVCVGGTRQVGDFNLSINQSDSKEIWEKSCKLMPFLKNAKVEWEWVGLRPNRDPPRVEKEIMKIKDKTLKVVHNYGHGSNGVTLSWGCAVHATKLVKEFADPITAKL